jgi:hypothetical protein
VSCQLIFIDEIPGDELLSDSFPYKEIENGILWEVEGKVELFLFVTSMSFVVHNCWCHISVCASEGMESLNLCHCYVVFCGYGLLKKKCMHRQQLDNLTLVYVLLCGSGLFKEQSM